MKGRLSLLLIMIGLFSCKKNHTTVVHEYTYAGITVAQSEQVEIINNTTNTIAWDTTYPDKIKVTYNDDFTTLTVNVSSQTHPCQTFKENFSFPVNSMTIYTENSVSGEASQTFEISSDSLYGYMLKQIGNDTNHTTYTLSFRGKLVQ